MLWLPLILGLTIGLLQPVKGAIIGFQWATGMHGFEDSKMRRDGLMAARTAARQDGARSGPM